MKEVNDQEVKAFISLHKDWNAADLALKLSKHKDLPKEYIINQIIGRQKARKKLPFLAELDTFTFPPTRAIEQASSEFTAKYKADLMQGNQFLDLSGGMGIDSYFISKNFKRAVYVEQNQELAKLTAYNFKQLKANHIKVVNAEADEYLRKNNFKWDWIYVDPDRRNAQERLFKIEDCSPNITSIYPTLLERSKHLLIKFSPFLDINQALKQLRHVKEIYILAYRNDCKELLFLLEAEYESDIRIITFNEGTKEEIYDFNWENHSDAKISYSDPLIYLYEPNVAVMKSGAFNKIAGDFSLYKIANNTHLYTSNERLKSFPGKTFLIKRVLKPSKGIADQVNIISRNFPMNAKEITKKYKIKEGGKDYLIAFRDQKNKGVFTLAELL